jgi:hypothetical protein
VDVLPRSCSSQRPIAAGMPRFDDVSADELSDVRQFIRSRANIEQ